MCGAKGRNANESVAATAHNAAAILGTALRQAGPTGAGSLAEANGSATRMS